MAPELISAATGGQRTVVLAALFALSCLNAMSAETVTSRYGEDFEVREEDGFGPRLHLPMSGILTDLEDIGCIRQNGLKSAFRTQNLVLNRTA